MKVAKVADGKIEVNREACNRCGRCVGKCPFGVFDESETGYRVYIGGRWGKKTAQGKALGKVFGSEDEVLSVVEKIILYYRDNGQPGERFADTIQRIGFATVEAAILG